MLIELFFHFKKLFIYFWFFFFNEHRFKIIKLTSGSPFKDFETIIDIGVLTLYTMVQVLKNSTAFIISFVVSNSSKHLTRGLPNIGDTLVYRAGILIYDIRVKYIRTFVSVLKYSDTFLVVYDGLFLHCVFEKQFLLVQ